MSGRNPMKPVGLARKTDLYESQTGNEKNSRSASDAMAFRLARPTLRSSFVSLGFSLVFLFFWYFVLLFSCSFARPVFLVSFSIFTAGDDAKDGRTWRRCFSFSFSFSFVFLFCFTLEILGTTLFLGGPT